MHIFGTFGVSVALLRSADRSPLAQRRVLARVRCIQANGHDTRRDTVLRAAELCRNLAEELGSDRGEDRDRISAELSPSNQRLPRSPYGGQQPQRALPAALELRGEQQMPLQLFLASCTAARRVHSAGSTLVRELKEHRTFVYREPFASGLHGGMRR